MGKVVCNRLSGGGQCLLQVYRQVEWPFAAGGQGRAKCLQQVDSGFVACGHMPC